MSTEAREVTDPVVIAALCAFADRVAADEALTHDPDSERRPKGRHRA